MRDHAPRLSCSAEAAGGGTRAEDDEDEDNEPPRTGDLEVSMRWTGLQDKGQTYSVDQKGKPSKFGSTLPNNIR